MKIHFVSSLNRLASAVGNTYPKGRSFSNFFPQRINRLGRTYKSRDRFGMTHIPVGGRRLSCLKKRTHAQRRRFIRLCRRTFGAADQTGNGKKKAKLCR